MPDALQATCPVCGAQYALELAMLTDDGKRLAAVLAVMDAGLARAVLGYVRLHQPRKRALTLTKARRLVDELAEALRQGYPREGELRPVSADGMRQALERLADQRDTLDLPLSGHGLLWSVLDRAAPRAELVPRADALTVAGDRPAAPMRSARGRAIASLESMK